MLQNFQGAPRSSIIYFNRSGSITGSRSGPLPFSQSTCWPFAATADFDLDGYQDVAIGCYGELLLVHPVSVDSYRADPIVGGGRVILDLAASDYSGDGRPDVLAAAFDAHAVQLFRTIPATVPVLGYVEHSARVPVDPMALVTDVDTPVLSGGQLTVSFGGGLQAGDRLRLQTGLVTISSNTVSVDGIATGTFTTGDTLTVSLNSAATLAAVQAIVRSVAYDNTSSNPGSAMRQVVFTLTDGAGGTSVPVTKPIAIMLFNDPPIADAGGGNRTVEGTSAAGAVVALDGSTQSTRRAAL